MVLREGSSGSTEMSGARAMIGRREAGKDEMARTAG
ncbi:MAG: hypothetical protein AVDCRST_MAG70-1010 [uncultured Thermomicrobiales bacterium]|uniref:Uncharacterized protein n=1 Tax=uncultured Thermomicrobiales bacterium TaxID=1645740 RepID=A0A6J4UKP1_9BACT|nr:MAG: hypothetical protein AVDCRST_MAG70-1010 [uncultured Thermomicrobiales bacterium]